MSAERIPRAWARRRPRKVWMTRFCRHSREKRESGVFRSERRGAGSRPARARRMLSAASWANASPATSARGRCATAAKAARRRWAWRQCGRGRRRGAAPSTRRPPRRRRRLRGVACVRRRRRGRAGAAAGAGFLPGFSRGLRRFRTRLAGRARGAAFRRPRPRGVRHDRRHRATLRERPPPRLASGGGAGLAEDLADTLLRLPRRRPGPTCGRGATRHRDQQFRVDAGARDFWPI